MSAPAPSQRLGSYELIALIGKGGMGEVWRAHDTRLNRDVAIKFCSQQFSERFEREARAIAALNHPNICTLYDVGPIRFARSFRWSRRGIAAFLARQEKELRSDNEA